MLACSEKKKSPWREICVSLSFHQWRFLSYPSKHCSYCSLSCLAEEVIDSHVCFDKYSLKKIHMGEINLWTCGSRTDQSAVQEQVQLWNISSSRLHKLLKSVFSLQSVLQHEAHVSSWLNRELGCTVLWSSSCWLIDSRWIGLFAHWFFSFVQHLPFSWKSYTVFTNSLCSSVWEESNTLSCSMREGNRNAGKTDTI
jgi:hypothetical protein